MSDRTPLALKYHGGKYYLAPKIVSLIPKHTHYVEPFFGGGAVLFAKDPNGISEVVNDIDGELTNFWNVIADDVTFEVFIKRMQRTPFCESAWINACKQSDHARLFLKNGFSFGGSAAIHYACSYFIRCRQSLAGRMKSFAPVSRSRTRSGMNEQASAWLNCVKGLVEVHDRLKRVVILNRKACSVISEQDGPETFYYLDPPYLHSTRTSGDDYHHEMSEAEHVGFLGLLSKIKGKFILSGYRSDLYDKMAKLFKWNRVDIKIPNNASGGKSKRIMTECLWLNF